MKKTVISVILTFCLLLTLAGCFAVHTDVPGSTASDGQTSETQPTPPASDATDGTEAEQQPEGDTTAAPAAEDTTEASTEAPAPNTEETVRQVMARMTLEEKVAQMFFVTPEQLTGISGYATVAGETTRQAFGAIPVGGVIYFAGNLQSTDQVKAMLSGMRDISVTRLGVPVFLGVDEEGGTVARISGTGKFGIAAIPNMSAVGASGDPEQARAIGKQIGGYLAELGFNVDFAPDTDVLSNPANTVVKYRSFGSDGDVVASFARAYTEGLQSMGVRGCYKHFPGHGATAEDSHEGFAVSLRTKDGLWENDLKPFMDGVRFGVPFIMSGHISLPNAVKENVPASLSYEMVTGLLRSEMRYGGIIITDALNMGAVTQNFGQDEAAVLAVKAGNDMLLCPPDLSVAYNAVLSAVRSGEISPDRIDQSVERILREKLR